MNEKRILLSESNFSQLTKIGNFQIGNYSVQFDKNDIRTLCKGEIIEKTGVDWTDTTYKFMLQDIGFDNINEILKRSPIFSELANNFLN